MRRAAGLAAAVWLAGCGHAAGQTPDAASVSDGAGGRGGQGGTTGAGVDAAPEAPAMATDATRTMTAWPKRSYDVHLPPAYDGVKALPVILALHGGGGNRASQHKIGCPNGDLADPACFERVSDARGFIVVAPDGTGAALAPNVRTWNSGGGSAGWQCVSGAACNDGVDEKQYFTDLLADLATVVRFDAARVYATGISNGASMSEALACQLPVKIAGIASVAGGNQWSTTRPCATAKPVLEIHGTADPCWPFAGGAVSCLDMNPGAKIGVPATLTFWRTLDQCQPTSVDEPLPDVADDGTTTVKHTWACVRGAVVFYEVMGGGHTWPGGNAYAPAAMVGPVARDFSANEVIVDFFANH